MVIPVKNVWPHLDCRVTVRVVRIGLYLSMVAKKC